MLFLEPSQNASPQPVVQCMELPVCTGSVLKVCTPADDERIECPDQLFQRPPDCSSGGSLFDLSPQVAELLPWNTEFANQACLAVRLGLNHSVPQEDKAILRTCD